VRPCRMKLEWRTLHCALKTRALTGMRAGPAQVLQPVRRVGGGPAAAAVLRLQHRALLLRGLPESRLARGAQGRVPAPASARLTGATAWQSLLGLPGSPCKALSVQGIWQYEGRATALSALVARE